MTYLIALKESRAQIVVDSLNNGTRIVSRLDNDGYVKLEVVINSFIDVLSLYHAGMDAQVALEREARLRTY